MAHWTKLQRAAIARLREAVRDHNTHETMPTGVIITRVKYAARVCTKVGIPSTDIDLIITEELNARREEKE